MANENNTLGGLIRILRQQNGWTLKQMSEKVSIPLSTLAKVESNQLSLTYDKLQQLASRLGMSLTEFLGQAEAGAPQSEPQMVTARRSVMSKDNVVVINTPNYGYEYLCTDLSNKRMVPILGRVRAHDISEFGDLVTHSGEEFIYVLEGSLEVHLQFYKPIRLNAGQGIYLDSSMGHAYTAVDCESALMLAVCSSEDLSLESELMSVIGGEAEHAGSANGKGGKR
jgi:transcriptional regulator with XRE-family HTH domain